MSDENTARYAVQRKVSASRTSWIDVFRIKDPGYELAMNSPEFDNEAGLDGVVASGHDIEMIRSLCGKEFIIVTPGVRIGEGKDDQKRTITPGEAVRKGATYIVLGRAVLASKNPKETLKQIEEEIRGAASRQQQ